MAIESCQKITGAKETLPFGSVGPEMLSPGGYPFGGSVPHIGRVVKPLEERP